MLESRFVPSTNVTRAFRGVAQVIREHLGLSINLLAEVLEVVRRSVWSIFRIEWECIQSAQGMDIPPRPIGSPDPPFDREASGKKEHSRRQVIV